MADDDKLEFRDGDALTEQRVREIIREEIAHFAELFRNELSRTGDRRVG